VFEDLHWVDPATDKFLANNLEAREGVPGLVIVNFRPEYHASWMSKSYYRQIGLAPLSAEAIEEMLGDLPGSDRSLHELPALIRGRTGGNPAASEAALATSV
jgi:adenylate cyclase